MKFIRISTLYIVPFILLSCKGSTQTQSSAQIKPKPVYSYVTEFEKFVKQTMDESHLPGAAIAIVKDSDILLLKGYGVKTIGFNDSVDIHTVFRIASVSKGFASMLAGILMQDSLINLDDKVVKYLPEFKLKSDVSTHQLTIRHILSHTSGLPTHTFTNMIEDGVPYAKLRDNLRTVDIAAPVGKEFAYQNVIYSLISDIVQSATKKTYSVLLHENVFQPLGMKDASASFEELIASKDVASPHLRRDSIFYTLIHNTPTYYTILPAAGVNASISDMSKWLMALLGERQEVISTATLNELYKPEIVTPRRRRYEFFRWPNLRKASYGLGWRVLNYGGDTIIYHGGHVNGFRSEVGFCPSSKVGIVILTNSTGKLANDGVQVFFDAFQAYKKSLPGQAAGLKEQ